MTALPFYSLHKTTRKFFVEDLICLKKSLPTMCCWSRHMARSQPCGSKVPLLYTSARVDQFSDTMGSGASTCARTPYARDRVWLQKCIGRIRLASKRHDLQVRAGALTLQGRNSWATGDLAPCVTTCQEDHPGQTASDNFLDDLIK
jgi:hypothetical protein